MVFVVGCLFSFLMDFFSSFFLFFFGFTYLSFYLFLCHDGGTCLSPIMMINWYHLHFIILANIIIIIVIVDNLFFLIGC